jgi:hypothetical protein
MKYFILLFALTFHLSGILTLQSQTLVEPRQGVEIPREVQAELTQGIQELEKLTRQVRNKLIGNQKLLRFLPDAEVFHESVQRTLEDRIFYSKKEFEVAKKLLEMGKERLEQLSNGKTPWESQTGLVVRGYVSKIDGSLQPYGLVVPGN